MNKLFTILWLSQTLIFVWCYYDLYGRLDFHRELLKQILMSVDLKVEDIFPESK